MATVTFPQSAALALETVVPDLVVVDLETACSRVSSICQIGIVGYRNGLEVFGVRDAGRPARPLLALQHPHPRIYW